jgi:hypothetical protein
MLKNYHEKGIALLPAVLMIGIIVVELGVALAFVIYLSNLSSYGARLSQEALYAARAGANDAVLRTVRDKDFPLEGYDDYMITIDRASVEITIDKNVPGTNQNTITAVATVLTRKKTMEAIVSINPTTGEVSIISFDEI